MQSNEKIDERSKVRLESWALRSRFKGSVEMLMLVGRQKGAVLVLE